MKILSLSLDNSALNKNSALAHRLVEYGELAEKYTAIVPDADNRKILLSEKAEVYGSGGDGKLARLIKIFNLAKRLLQEEKYDVITVQDQYYLALIGRRLAKKFRTGLEIQVHGFEKFYGLRKLAARYALPRAQAVRCVSQRLRKQLIEQFGVAERKITVAPIFTERRSAAPGAKAKINDGKFIFLTVGRLAPVKNVGLQIEAMREITKKYSNAELWIVGDGQEKDNYERQIKDYGLEANIKMLGWKNSLSEFYSQADVFVLTSNFEGWGLAVIEASNCGLPIIMTDVGLAGEVIKDGESGLIIPTGDKQKLVEAMGKIIEDENLRKKIGANAKLAANRLPDKGETLDLIKMSWQKAVTK